MAIFGLNVKTISRLRGESAAKTAAYILRENLYDPYWKKTHYFSQVKDLMYSEILIPEEAPCQFHELGTLLKAIETAEKRYDARIGRVVRLTLPNDAEISDEERIKLAKNFINEAFIDQGICAVLAIHKGENVIPSKCNPHAHVMITDRQVDVNGFCGKKNRDWNKKERIYKWRKLWEEVQNNFFLEKGMEVRVSHRSLEVQGIDREPTRPLGREATALERKGIQTEQGNRNRAIEARYKEQEEKRVYQKERRHKRDKARSR